MNPWADMQSRLEQLRQTDMLRAELVMDSACGPRVIVDGREVVCLCSNDYLGLAGDPAVRAAAARAVAKWGVGAGASRLVSGTSRLHADLERRLAEFKRTEAAVVASTGWAANHLAVHALAGAGDLICSDKLNHASIIDAALSSGARLRTYPHRDTARLRSLLESHRAKHRRCLIVTDSLFSMDGDLAPLAELAELKDRYDAQLLLDEAHATGVLGEGGRGAAELAGVENRIDAVVGTLSKAIGALGGFVAGPAALIETIRNTGRPYIYSTALPPAICAAATESLRIIEREPARRRRVLELASGLRELLAERKRPTGDSRSQIIPVVIGEAGEAVRVSRRLLEAGFLVPAIRPPTVPRGASRLRVSLSALHAEEDLRRFVQALGSAAEEP
jgi:8-amino-7-oxononanoate synthase